MKFVIDNTVEFSATKTSPLERDVKRALDRLPPGHLLTINKLAAMVSRSVIHLRHSLKDAQMEAYRYRNGSSYLYGSKKTINALYAKG